MRKLKYELLDRVEKLINDEFERKYDTDLLNWIELARRLAKDVIEVEDVIKESVEYYSCLINPQDRRIAYLGRKRER